MDVLEVDLQHPLRGAVERYIASVYSRAFDAQITLFAPHLFAAIDDRGQIRCAAGLRSAEERFHCECYLDRPAEQAVAAVLRRPVDRAELLEFTTFACARPGDAFGFISDIVQLGRDRDCGIALFTGTASLRKLLARTGLTIVPIVAAQPRCVADPQSWGRYYATDPWVCVVPDSPFVPSVLRAPCFPSGRALANRQAELHV